MNGTFKTCFILFCLFLCSILLLNLVAAGGGLPPKPPPPRPPQPPQPPQPQSTLEPASCSILNLNIILSTVLIIALAVSLIIQVYNQIREESVDIKDIMGHLLIIFIIIIISIAFIIHLANQIAALC